MVGHIYIYGEITSYQDESMSSFGAVNPKDVLNQISLNNQATELVVHINSPGGDVDAGFAIFDLLKTSGKEITTHIEGQCYSIATVIALSGSKRLATQNSEYLIHNPWTMGAGTSKDFEKTQKELKRFEDKIANLYASVGVISFDDALTEMEKDTYMDLAQAKEYGLITEIVETVKAVAKFNLNDKSMSNEKSILAQVKDLLVGKDEVKAITLKDAENNDVIFDERTEGKPQKGDKATSGNEILNGDVLMANGDTFVFSNGVLDDIKEKENKPEFDVAAFKSEILAEVKKDIKADYDSRMSQIKQENKKVVDALQAKIDEKETFINNLKNIVSGESTDTVQINASATDVVIEEDENPLVAGLKKLTKK